MTSIITQDGATGAFGHSSATTLTAKGILPSGLSFTANGNGTAPLSGTPQPGTGGVVNLTITAGNGAASIMQTLKLTVDQPPAFTSAAQTTFTAGQANSFQITTAGFPVAVISFSGTLPTGVSLAANKSNGTAVLSGTPTVPGSYTFVITASNGVLASLVQTFTLTVSPKG